jgi:methylated-DNA-[protein]-cysteine S-methyltransferase
VVGTIKLWATTEGLRRLDFRTGPDLVRPDERLSTDKPPLHLIRALDALQAYFQRRIRIFDLPLDLGSVTDFQRQVYDHLVTIPYGHVTTYADVAKALGMGDGGARAVGQAVGANPVSVVIPCHRVVGSDGALHGYGGGLARKAALLRLEGIDVDGESATSKVHPEVLRLPL